MQQKKLFHNLIESRGSQDVTSLIIIRPEVIKLLRLVDLKIYLFFNLSKK